MAGPTLTQNLDGNPWVEVFFNPADLDPACTSLRIYRFSEGRTWLVRGGVDIAPGVAAIDFEVPFGVPSSYRAEMFNSSGVSLGFTDISETTVNVEGTWVHQPLQPTLAIQMTNLSGSAETLTRPTPGEVVYVEGAPVGRHIGSRRHGLQSVPVVLLAETLTAANAFQAMLGTYEVQQIPVLCIRTSEDIRWPRTFFASTGELFERELTVHAGGELVQFEGDFDEVAPPFPGLVKPLLTYDDIDAAFATYDAADAAFATYTERDRAYEYAGLAEGGI